ncbi:hypothetical protein [Methylobacterium sp.]|nr:hypothetical protein [Methylobacterium sp.]
MPKFPIVPDDEDTPDAHGAVFGMMVGIGIIALVYAGIATYLWP